MDCRTLHGSTNSSNFIFEDKQHNDDDVDIVVDLQWPFDHLDSLDWMTFVKLPTRYSSRLVDRRRGSGSPNGRVNRVVMSPTSKVKKALGLKMKKSPSRRMSMFSTGLSTGSGAGSGTSTFVSQGHGDMRQQMKVTEQSDNRLRKTITRTLVGQTGKRSETIILPLELLRYLKPSEFSDAHEYHLWQKRQLKILDAGLIQYPSIPIDKACSFMIPLTNNGSPTTSCHWADGYPLNVHIYTTLLRSIFSIRDETLVLDEVDELLELMKKTWPTLGLNKPMHNACFAWVFFEQYIVTSQTEPDLLAAYIMLSENWAEKKLLNYHEYFNRGNIGGIENLLPMALLSTKILVECIKKTEGMYHRVLIRHIVEKENAKNDAMGGREDAYVELLQLAKETEDLAARERELFSPILKKWHPTAAGVAGVILHQCYGAVLKEYLAGTRMLNSEIVWVLERASKLEKVLDEMVVEDFGECANGGKVTWCPISKSERYAHSAVELMNLIKQTVNDFLEIPVGITEDLILDLAEGIEQEIAAYRLIFLDTNLVFYESLYISGVASSRIRPALRIINENIKLLNSILIDQVQALAMKEVMKTLFEAFLVILLAGVPARNFNRSDYNMIEEDFQSLKRVFSAFGERLISEDVVQKEAEKAEGVISLMGQNTEQLIEEFRTAT
ncbi:Cyclopropane-fatty-acyl-phospholipid synthase isoform 1 [Hibiscus syriacus]|uniref:Cyclopropane-fatty-acyl-phospholipid synthase isoform 1 n=1 Tax=Hibiscus syriacus TaxID=106335 RepID=A0A6A2ZYB1_HIBSY|nr:Cyclopropane-fatty-acyl-phospholipid synthase isoform 1 [Hibiscus syriacus]